jgi:hypothetical protein
MESNVNLCNMAGSKASSSYSYKENINTKEPVTPKGTLHFTITDDQYVTCNYPQVNAF